MSFFENASFALVGTKAAAVQLFAGEAPVITDSAPALVDIVKHEVLALMPTGVTPFVTATHTAEQAVIASHAATAGQQLSYYQAGRFNHAALVWPADLDTLAERKALVAGSMLSMGHLI